MAKYVAMYNGKPRRKPRDPKKPPFTPEMRRLNRIKYKCHKLREKLWDMDNKKERRYSSHWIKGHIGENLITASYEELERLEFYLSQKIKNGHCPLHMEENASTRYKKHGGSTKARAKLKEKLIARDGEKCIDCNRSDVALTLDHIHPISLGGGNTMDNTQLLCEKCHTKKTKSDSKIAYERYFAANFPEKWARMKKGKQIPTHARTGKITREAPLLHGSTDSEDSVSSKDAATSDTTKTQ